MNVNFKIHMHISGFVAGENVKTPADVMNFIGTYFLKEIPSRVKVCDNLRGEFHCDQITTEITSTLAVVNNEES